MMNRLNGCIFFAYDDDLLQKHNTIWDKVCTDIIK